MQKFNAAILIAALLISGCAANKQTYPLPRSAFPEPGIYLVQPGDTETLIAKHLCLSVDQLSTLNPGTDWARLRVGQRLHYSN